MKILVFQNRLYYIIEDKIYSVSTKENNNTNSSNDNSDNIKFESPSKSPFHSFTLDEFYISITDKNKNLYLLNQDFQVIQSFQCKKLVSFLSIYSDKDSLFPSIYTADNNGDITLYRPNPSSNNSHDNEKKDQEKYESKIENSYKEIKENQDNSKESKIPITINDGEIICGHLSIITSLQVCQNWILSSDRDEKIRLSHRSKPFLIEAFLLGHGTFVSKSIMINENLIYSIDGDGLLIKWIKKEFESKINMETELKIENDEKNVKEGNNEKKSFSNFEFIIEKEIKLPQKDPLDMIHINGKLFIVFDQSNKIIKIHDNNDKNYDNGNETKSNMTIETIVINDGIITSIANLNDILILSMDNGQIINENMEIIKHGNIKKILSCNIDNEIINIKDQEKEKEISNDGLLSTEERNDKLAWRNHLRKKITRKYIKKNKS